MKRKRRKYKKNYTIYYLILSILTVITVTALSLTVLFPIRAVEVDADAKYDEKRVIESAQFKIGENLFRADVETAEDSILAKHTDLDSVEVSRKFPDRIKIQIKVSQPAFVGVRDQKYYVISKGNRMIQTGEKQTDQMKKLCLVKGLDFSKFKVGDFIEEQEQLELYESLRAACAQVKLDKINQMDLSDPYLLKLEYDHRITILLGSKNDLHYKLTVAQKIITTELEAEETGTLDVSSAGESTFRAK